MIARLVSRFVLLFAGMTQRLSSYSPFLVTTLCCAFCTPTGAQESKSARRTFDLPHGDAAVTLGQFAAHAREQIVYRVDQVRGERTNAVVGEYADREALQRMLAGTGLIVIEDAASGALIVSGCSSSTTQTIVGDATSVSLRYCFHWVSNALCPPMVGSSVTPQAMS